MKGQEWYQAKDIAEDYDTKRFSRGGRLIDEREKQAVLDAVSPVEDKRILEIACGTGRFTTMLADRSGEIIGLDISNAMLQQGRQKVRNNGVGDSIEFLRGDAARLPFPDNHFDAVFAIRFFHLAETPASFLREMSRVSRDQVFFDTFNRYSTRTVYNWLLPMGSRLYSESEVDRLLRGADLTLIDEAHDFVLPYGFYRQIPDEIASSFRDADTTVGETSIGDLFASVSYWNATVQ
ncbi:class I SAM-dependent methyltransferase [Halocatena salina]|uniref:Methyltransferase domain-containing protein n=1 Tax=Halocatena salina TaxID=2934340 RepID=A0A8U0A320_9EURY|nr:methyltransferase domain-containing protein [Halocatena salina]UPM42403.1 methyltransferase domain-containing protein [Halocatena salina]